jgi:hypothetical protein
VSPLPLPPQPPFLQLQQQQQALRLKERPQHSRQMFQVSPLLGTAQVLQRAPRELAPAVGMVQRTAQLARLQVGVRAAAAVVRAVQQVPRGLAPQMQHQQPHYKKQQQQQQQQPMCPGRRGQQQKGVKVTTAGCRTLLPL